MARRKIAILGGGVAALATAFELTRTPDLAARHDVTVYQMGWRLGGKCASSRSLDPARGLRIEEHGLHVWLGFYENAFAWLRDVYAARPLQADDALRSWRDAFIPRSFTPIGESSAGGWAFADVDWPTNDDVPGDGRLTLTPWGVITELLSTLERLLGGLGGGAGDAASPGLVTWAASLWRDLLAGWGRLEAPGAAELLARASLRARMLTGAPALSDPAEHAELSTMLARVRERLRASVPGATGAAGAGPAQASVRVCNLLELGIAIVRGMLSPRYGILAHGDLERIDDQDLRAWLVENGASSDVVFRGSELRAFYDLAFAYEDGRRARPRWAAGTALRALLRIVLTYKQAVLFLPTAGMGEVLIAPVYQVLRARGVSFEFFRKVNKLELSPDRNVVARVKLGVQARTKAARPYEPLVRAGGLWAWPSEPLWDQLEDGDRMKAAGAALESTWCAWPPVGEATLEVGRDFDDVVLAMSLGAFKRLGDEPTVCDDLYEASPRFAAMAEALNLVPSQALQVWTVPSLAGLGWSSPPPAMDGGPEPLGIWADMSHQIAREAWAATPAGPLAPGSLQYFCGVWATDLHRRPSTDASVPAEAQAAVRKLAVEWFDKNTGAIWPGATRAGSGAALDYARLFDPANGVGEARLDAQWIRANVDPTECCVASLDGTTSLRLGAGESGFVNLVLAGDWTKNGMNVASVEGAVMSGMAASRVLCGAPRDIVGELFLRQENPRGPEGLPPYVSGLRHGEQSFQPPGLTRGGRIHLFPVEADPAQIQQTVDAFFTVPSRGAVRYSVLGSHVIVVAYNAPELTSLSQQVGTLPDRECGFCVPLVRLHPRGPKLVFWLPYIVIDSSVGMVTGREIWGFPKEIGTHVFPAEGDPARFVVSATLFPRLARETQGVLAPLVTIERPGVMGALASRWSEPGHAVAEVVRALSGGSGKMPAHAAEGGLLTDALSLFEPFAMTIANLKQFRDATLPTRACYQAIVESPLRFQPATFRGAGLLGDGFELTLTPAESHMIARDLGLGTGQRLPVKSPFYIDIGFTADGGEVLWQA